MTNAVQLETKGDLYKLILAESRENKPKNDEEFRAIVHACCAEFNRANGFDELPIELREDLSVQMTVNYIVDFRLFLRSVHILARDYQGPLVQRIIHQHDPDCQCLLKLLFWFWNVTEKADEFVLSRFK